MVIIKKICETEGCNEIVTGSLKSKKYCDKCQKEKRSLLNKKTSLINKANKCKRCGKPIMDRSEYCVDCVGEKIKEINEEKKVNRLNEENVKKYRNKRLPVYLDNACTHRLAIMLDEEDNAYIKANSKKVVLRRRRRRKKSNRRVKFVQKLNLLSEKNTRVKQSDVEWSRLTKKDIRGGLYGNR